MKNNLGIYSKFIFKNPVEKAPVTVSHKEGEKETLATTLRIAKKHLKTSERKTLKLDEQRKDVNVPHLTTDGFRLDSGLRYQEVIIGFKRKLLKEKGLKFTVGGKVKKGKTEFKVGSVFLKRVQLDTVIKIPKTGRGLRSARLDVSGIVYKGKQFSLKCGISHTLPFAKSNGSTAYALSGNLKLKGGSLFAAVVGGTESIKAAKPFKIAVGGGNDNIKGYFEVNPQTGAFTAQLQARF